MKTHQQTQFKLDAKFHREAMQLMQSEWLHEVIMPSQVEKSP
jgi:hypothetical protein